jgi:hypothetical protein
LPTRAGWATSKGLLSRQLSKAPQRALARAAAAHLLRAIPGRGTPLALVSTSYIRTGCLSQVTSEKEEGKEGKGGTSQLVIIIRDNAGETEPKRKEGEEGRKEGRKATNKEARKARKEGRKEGRGFFERLKGVFEKNYPRVHHGHLSAVEARTR